MGIGVPYFDFSQGILKAEKVISHLQIQSMLVTLIQIVMEWCHITGGTQTSILVDTSTLQYIYMPCVQSLRYFLRKQVKKLDTQTCGPPLHKGKTMNA